MKKKVQLFFMLAMLLLVGKFLVVDRSQKLQFELSEDDSISILLTANYKQQRIYPWYNESDSTYYFFLPAFCQSDFLRFHKIGEDKTVFLNEMNVQSGSKFALREKEIYKLQILTEDATADYDIIFLRSENLPAVFVGTDSGNMEYIHANKENEEQGNIDIITADGTLEYSGRLSKVSGRGNTTWMEEKKPYSIALKEEEPLLGMDGGKNWYLLSGFFEGAKLNNKIAFDIAELVGLAYSPQCTWIDLYLNGEYVGIYLLSESVSVGKGRVDIHDLEKQNKANNLNIEEADIFEEDNMKGYIIDNIGNISGGYLFEKDAIEYWGEKGAGFKTLNNNVFTIKSPKHASREQVVYLSRYVQNIDDMLNDGNEEYRNYIDFESFAQKFIVDEIAFNFDTNVTSMFYYKKMNDDLIYAGPVWDFEEAFGEGNGGFMEGYFVNYEATCIYPFRGEEEILNWYARLYDDEVFRNRVTELYSDALPGIEELIETKIDIYADYIRKAVELDKIRWAHVDTGGDHPGHYTEFDNNVRYLKYFLAKRISYLNERWGVDYHDVALPNSEETHEITFWLDGELIETREVADGETLTLEELPYLDENIFYGWYFTHSNEKYRVHIPIYEDVDLYARRKEE